MKPVRTSLASLLLLSITISISIATSLCHARILNVPEEFQTIQAGIDSARAGDTVLVAPGVYDENVIFRANGTVLGSLILTTGIASYIDSTIIDAGRRDCGISVEVDSGLVRGFTVRNGLQDLGGGIDIRNGAGPRCLEDMIITNDSARHGGGGIYISNGGEVILRRVRIFDNGAAYGAGLDIGEFVGGIVRVEDCEIVNNRSTYMGGGFAVHAGYPPNLFFNRVLIAGNTAPKCAAAYFRLSNVNFTNTTIFGNIALDDSTGGIGGFQGSNVTMENCIIYANSQPQISCNEVDERGFRCEISFSDILGGNDGIERHRNGLQWGDGNIDADPLFLDPDNGNYHLSANSPCIDAGDPEAPLDPDGTRADIGAFYFHQRDIEVEPAQISFDTLFVGESISNSVSIRNLGKTPLQIRQISIAGDYYSMEQEENIELAPDSARELAVTFTPGDDGEWIGVITIVSNDPDEDSLQIPLLGYGRWYPIDSVPSDTPQPISFNLQAAYPNPFNNSTTIRFSTGPINREATLRVYGVDGRLVQELWSGRHPPLLPPASGGVERSVVWNAEGLPGGVYVVRLEAGGEVRTMKAVLLR